MANIPYTFAGDTGNIPLSQLDDNFANVKAFAETAGYVTANAQANITSVGTLTSLSVSGNVTGANANIVNLTATNFYSANITGLVKTANQPNITALGNLVSLTVAGSAQLDQNLTVVGNASIGVNLFTYNLTANNDATVSGNLLVSGNATVNGTTTIINSQTLNITDKNITIANGVSTSVLIDGAGIDAGNPTVAYIRYSDAVKGWTTGNNVSVGGNLSVTGTGGFSGVLTAPTAANATSNTQVATTAFAHNIVTAATGALGTMSTQNANNVSITGGNINSLAVTSIGNNSFGTRTVSSSSPTGGSNGDIWYKI